MGFFRKIPSKYVVFIVTMIWTLLILGCWEGEFLKIRDAENLSRDYRFQARGPQEPDPDIVLVGIDATSIFQGTADEQEIRENPGYELLNNFPYPRRTYALIIEKLAKAGAKAIVFDLVLAKDSPLGTEEERKADNRAFQEAIQKYQNLVVLGGDITNAETGRDLPNQPTEWTMPNPDLLPEGLAPEKLVGYVNVKVDPDSVIRKMRPVNWVEHGILPLSMYALAVHKAFPDVPLPQPLQDYSIKYAGPEGTYPVIPLQNLFWVKGWKFNLQDGEVFKDKIVIIGPTAPILHDVHSSPWGIMPGPEIQCNAMASILRSHCLTEWGGIKNFLLILISGLVLGSILSFFKSPLMKLVPAVLLGGAYLAISQYCFVAKDLFLPLVPVLAMMILSTATVVSGQAVMEQLEKRRLSGMLSRYVSKNVAAELIKSGQSIDSLMTPQERTVTVLFSDVRDFTTMSEMCNPSDFVHQLNEYLTEMVKCVFNHDGTLDKFVGDAVMAVFGNPTSKGHAEDAWCAVQSAVEMRERLAALNARWEKEGRPIYRIGIGLNHGKVMAGDIGSAQKAEIGVIGDTVNVAARVESLTKEQKVDILISDSVYQLVKDKVEVESRGELQVKGRNKPVGIYALVRLK